MCFVHVSLNWICLLLSHSVSLVSPVIFDFGQHINRIFGTIKNEEAMIRGAWFTAPMILLERPFKSFSAKAQA